MCPALCDRRAWLLSVLPSCWGAGASRGGCGHLSGLTPVPKGWHSSGSSDPDGKKMLRGLASLQTLSAHVDKPPSSAGGQKHQAVVTGSDVTLGEQSRWDWGHCMGGQLLTGRGWAQGRGPGGAGLLRASGAGTCWLRALTPRPPATPSSSARHFLTLGAGTGSRPGWDLSSCPRKAGDEASLWAWGQGPCRSRHGPEGGWGGGQAAAPAEQLRKARPTLGTCPGPPGLACSRPRVQRARAGEARRQVPVLTWTRPCPSLVLSFPLQN